MFKPCNNHFYPQCQPDIRSHDKTIDPEKLSIEEKFTIYQHW